jgi:PilZ domain
VEHRLGSRSGFTARVLLETIDGGVTAAILCDVSSSGARVRSPVRVPLDTRLAMRLAVLDEPDDAATEPIVGQVVRYTADGFALQWLKLLPQVVRTSPPPRRPIPTMRTPAPAYSPNPRRRQRRSTRR